MKLKHLVAALAALLLCASCADLDSLRDPEEQIKNDYLRNWIMQYGLIDPNHNWNMAELVKAKVDPESFGEEVTVELYSVKPNGNYILVGRASSNCTLNLDVVRGSSEVLAVAKRDGQAVASETYPISGGEVNISHWASSRAANNQVEVPANVDNFQWTIACEDMGDVGDFDFNDIVFGINHVATDGINVVEITALAAGGILASNIYLGNEEVGEIHSLIKSGSPTTSMLNTTEWKGLGKAVRIKVDNGWSITTNMGGITIEVEGVNARLAAPALGGSPQMICIAGDWFWPYERTSIRDAYISFKNWTGNANDINWSSDYESAASIVWKKNAVSNTNSPTPDYSKNMIIAGAAEWSSSWNGTGAKLWDYVPGLVTKAIASYCELYGTDKVGAFDPYSMCKAYCAKGMDDNGTINSDINYKASLDNLASAKVLLSMYRLAPDNEKEKYRTLASTMYSYLLNSYPRMGDDKAVKKDGVAADATVVATTRFGTDNYDITGGFWHKAKEYPNQMWLDGLYMGAAGLAEYIAMFDKDNTNAWALIVKQFEIIDHVTYDSTTGLNYHGWSAQPGHADSFWANSTTGCSQEFWGRGMGWYFAALVDVLESLQKAGKTSSTYYTTIKNIYKKTAAGVLYWQDNASGVWYQLMAHDSTYQVYDWNKINDGVYDWTVGAYTVEGNRHNYLEASASSMFTYALLKGIRIGVFNDNDSELSVYKAAAKKAYNGLLTQFISGSGSSISINSICKSAGLGHRTKPYRDGSASYYIYGSDAKEVVSNEGKGIGPFIFASLEYERLGYGLMSD